MLPASSLQDVSEGIPSLLLTQIQSQLSTNTSSIYQQRSPDYIDSFNHIAFQWDTRNISENLDISDDERICTSKTSMNSFKSCYGSTLMLPGFRYYYEVKFIKGSNFKIGVSRSKRNLEIAFSDVEDGWAYYSNGQLRHNSKGEGLNYGSIFRGKDVIGVFVDLVEGKLFFSKNGKIFKDAYRDEELTKQPLYPACSCLTKGESFELLFPACED
eukprot:403358421